MAELDDLLDPVRLEQIVRALEAIAASVSSVDREIDGAGKSIDEAKRSGRRVLEDVNEFGRVVKGTIDNTGVHYRYFIRTEFLQGTEQALERAKAKWKAYGDEVRRHMSEARGGVGAAGGALGMSGPRGIAQGMNAQFQQIAGSLPFGVGGILGLMLYGKKREQEFDAAATRITRILDQVGAGAGAADRVRSRVVAMNAAFGSSGEELQAVIDAFRQVGMGAEMFDDVGRSAGALGKDLVGVVTAMEMANRMGPGTIAKMIGEIFEAGGGSRQQLIDDFTSLDGVAQQTGVSIERLMSTMVQSATSLKTQRQGVSDLAGAYIKLYNSLGSGAMQGAAPQAVGAAAMRGVQQAAGGLAGLSEGLMAELSRRMGGPEGVGGIVAMQEGMRGQGQFAGKSFEELGKLAQEITGGGSREEQIFALEKIAPSLGFEGARAVVDQMSGNATLDDIVQAVQDPDRKLATAFDRRAKEESEWEKLQRKLMLHLAAIGSSMLTITMAGFDTLITVIASGIPGSGTSLAQGARAMVGFADVQETEAYKIAQAVNQALKDAGAAGDFKVPSFIANAAERKEAKEAAAKAESAAVIKSAEAASAAARQQVNDMVEGNLSPVQRAGMVGAVSRARDKARERWQGEGLSPEALEEAERGAGRRAGQKFIDEKSLADLGVRLVVERVDLGKGESPD